MGFLSALGKSIDEATGTRKEKISTLVSALWTELVRERLGASSYYELERIMLPGSFGKNKEGKKIYRNRWSKYATGKHIPSGKFIDQIDHTLPGTKAFFVHPFWSILRTPDANPETMEIWRDRMLNIRQIVDEAFLVKGNEYGIRKVSDTKLRMLENRPGLEAMAGFSILLLKALKRGTNSDVPFRISEYLYRMTAAVCLRNPFNIAPSILFEFVCTRLITKGTHPDGYRITSEYFDFDEILLLLKRETQNQFQFTQQEKAEIAEMKLAIDLLRGKKGFDIRHGLGPRLALANQAAMECPKISKALRQYEDDRLTNFESIKRGEVNRFAVLWPHKT